MTRGRIATHLAAVSPAGSVGASALQRCPPDTRTAMTERQLTAHLAESLATKLLVILSAKHERIRNILKKRTDCHTPNGVRNDEGGENGLPRG